VGLFAIIAALGIGVEDACVGFIGADVSMGGIGGMGGVGGIGAAVFIEGMEGIEGIEVGIERVGFVPVVPTLFAVAGGILTGVMPVPWKPSLRARLERAIFKSITALPED
jgi:hypothetical protein